MAATSMFTATSAEAARYRAILEEKIQEGSRSAVATIERIQREVPTDRIVGTRGIDFSASTAGLEILVGEDRLRPSNYALGQIAEKAKVPGEYLRSLVAPGADPWRHELAAEVLRKHYRNRDAEKMLARSVDGELRGWLSDRYRRLDARPLLDALVVELERAGAVPYYGTATDTRVALKALVPEIVEPVPGEYMVLGLEWGNSDYGNGPHRLAQFGIRVACLNGMTRDSVLREIHVGGRLSDNDIRYSQRTYELDTRASVSALKDTVRGVLGSGARTKFLDSIRAANEREVTAESLRRTAKNLPEKTKKAVVDAFTSSDVINLPAGNTAWRASNAISWIAKTATGDTRLDLERLAGKIVV